MRKNRNVDWVPKSLEGSPGGDERPGMKQLFEVGSDRLGRGPVSFAWSPNGQFIATASCQLRLLVHDRKGNLHDEIQIPGRAAPGQCAAVQLAWDRRSEKLALLTAGSKPGIGDAVVVYKVRQREAMRLENVQMAKELTHIAWDPQGHVLSVGTAKGNLLLYDTRIGKTMSIMGKHTKGITCGAWSADGRLALGGDDKQITVSLGNGDTEFQLAVKDKPKDLQFAPEASSGGSLAATKRLNQISATLLGGLSSIYLYRLGEFGEDPPDIRNPAELRFDPYYGKIKSHHWAGAGYLVVCFDSGQCVLCRMEGGEMEQELCNLQPFTGAAAMAMKTAFCADVGRLAVFSGPTVKMIDVSNGDLTENTGDTLEFSVNCEVTCLGWSMEGQVLTVATSDGELYTFLASLPNLCRAFGDRCAYLTSLLEVTVADVSLNKLRAVAIDQEPVFLALGHQHVAAGMNNQAWFYRVGPPEEGLEYPPERVNQREYMGSVDEVSMNDTLAAVRSEGRVNVHVIEHNDDPTESMDFQLPAADITSVAMTRDFLVYGTASGNIVYYYLPGRTAVSEYRHEVEGLECGIVKVYPNQLGTRCAFIGFDGVAMVYNPVSNQSYPMPEVGSTVQAILWDVHDPNTVVVATGAEFQVYTFADVTINGSMVEAVGSHPQMPGAFPVLFSLGKVTCQVPGGRIHTELLSTHAPLVDPERPTNGDRGRDRFVAALNMNRLQDAWEVAAQMQMPEMWEQLAHRAMTHMEIEFAIRVYRFVGDASMVMSLERLEHIEDKDMLAGNILILFERDDCYDMAQELFLRSGRPQAALEMRKDLKHWEEALELAKTADPGQLDDICREYAGVLESRGEHDAALELYERAVKYPDQSDKELARGNAGIARCLLHLGDVRRGKIIALDSGSEQLCRECADICEKLQQHEDAAQLYERGGEYEKAAAIYIDTKLFHLARPIMQKVSTPKLHARYARAKENEGKLKEAADAYELARDFDSVVRLQLEHLGDPDKAFALVRMSRSVDGALMCAKWCKGEGAAADAIEFLLIGRKVDEAFQLARERGEMDLFVTSLGDGGTPEDYRRLAKFFEKENDPARAGDMYAACGERAAAVGAYLRDADKPGVLDKAIDVVGEARDDSLTSTLVDYLMGESDGVPKDANYLFRLHIALRDYDAAAKTTVLIARQEQEMGNYKMAHRQLFDAHRELTGEGRRPPPDLTESLMLLHSYALVKLRVKRKDHTGAARLLRRVASSIDKFPAHVVPILTSTVIECQRAGLKRSALEFATRLMQPEHRKQIAEAYKRKIETIVRKPDRTEAEAEASPCPMCDATGSEWDLTCDSCSGVIPYCVATGKRVRVGEWARCPECLFPCNAGDFVDVVAQEKACPMCSREVSLSAVHPLDDPLATIGRGSKVMNEANGVHGMNEE